MDDIKGQKPPMCYYYVMVTLQAKYTDGDYIQRRIKVRARDADSATIAAVKLVRESGEGPAFRYDVHWLNAVPVNKKVKMKKPSSKIYVYDGRKLIDIIT